MPILSNGRVSISTSRVRDVRDVRAPAPAELRTVLKR